jgi:3-oxoacyl-[acyl-carrier-protein] synthase II
MNFARGDGTPRFNPFFIPKMIADSSLRHHQHAAWAARAQLCDAERLRQLQQCHDRRLQLHPLGHGGRDGDGGQRIHHREVCMGGFNAMHALSTRNDDPATASRPYDKDRDGFVMGEGAAALILEDLEHALARGAKIYCEMVGGGMSSDAYHITAPHPEGLGAYLCMKHALQNAGLKPSDIDYINTHGTSTPIGDPQEVKAIQRLFGEDAYRLNISSTKSMTGHLLGAAGAVEGIASIMALVKGSSPPTINHFTDDPGDRPQAELHLQHRAKARGELVMSNTFGFGGHNTSVIFRKYH